MPKPSAMSITLLSGALQAGGEFTAQIRERVALALCCGYNGKAGEATFCGFRLQRHSYPFAEGHIPLSYELG
ncbi:hypothetical protein PsB1_1261 [Candidatus Phycosocius spiralis]|uniref:Uncharacterized protein n=1 Tax=Candidatus Phycosocius spiralis TaxID=2815099 RepID=A0ABQ4PVU0_9PROT|nr:hypothetical protein PsB1_1261 [Candidatus Phycosocius spiralis]